MAGADEKPVSWMKSALKFLLLAGLVIGVFTYLTTSTDSFKQVVKAGGDFGSTALVTGFNWGTAKMGGTAATAGEAATTGPATIWVENKAPKGWNVRQAVLTWNKGLTTVKLRLGACHEGVQCIHVKQVDYLAPTDGRLTLGRTTTFLSTSVKFNADAKGQVPASFFQVAACHELGHALGAEHNPSKGSCMHATIGKGIPARPDAADYTAVNDRYR